MKRAQLSLHQRPYQAGAGMVEVLITVLILAIGLLGLSALQLSSLKSNHSAMQRSIAVLQSYTIVEAIRADTDAAKQGSFNINLNATPGSGSFAATVHQLWHEQLQLNLGTAATGSVDCNASKCTIIVQWDDSRASQDKAKTNAAAERTQVVTEVLL